MPAPFYWNGRVSNGPVAAEIMQDIMGVDLIDHAWAGATTGVGNINDIPTIGTTTTLGSEMLPGMRTTFDTEKASLLAIAPSSEFILWGGAMDFIYPSEPFDQVIGRGVTNLVSMTYELQAMGAGRIIVPGMPDLGLTPRVMSCGPAAAAGSSYLTDFFNDALKANLPPGAIFFDTAALMRQIIANPAGYGFTNVTEPCMVLSAGSFCADPDSYFLLGRHSPDNGDSCDYRRAVSSQSPNRPPSFSWRLSWSWRRLCAPGAVFDLPPKAKTRLDYGHRSP